MKSSRKALATVAVHAGSKTPPSVTRPKVSPIYASSVFSFDRLDQIDEVYEGQSLGYVYSRMRNPGLDALEEAVASLEGGTSAVAFASGMAAISASVMANVAAGDHVLAADVLYGGTYSLFRDELPRRGVSITFVDISDIDAVKSQMRSNTKILYCETISNPIMEVADLETLAVVAHEAGALLVVDNTFASPILCQPISYGADIVLHSGTKYLNGHSDGMSGVAVTKSTDADRIRSYGTTYGPTLSPFDAFLLLRGIRTLALRVERQCENAMRLAEFLESHPAVTLVHYPGLPSSATHGLALKYLTCGFGGMLSLEVEGGLDGAKILIDSLEMVELVPSLAGVSTTVSHPGKTSHRAIPPAERESLGVGNGLIRVSVGIEAYRDILDDFSRALDAVQEALLSQSDRMDLKRKGCR